MDPHLKAMNDLALASHLSMITTILGHGGVSDAKNKAAAAGIPFFQILITILPFVLQALSGGTIDWQAIIAAILALINPPAPSLMPTPQ